MTAFAPSYDPRSEFVDRLRPAPARTAVSRRAIFRGIAAGTLVCVGIQVSNFLARDNFHVVQPGRVFRSSQLSAERLQNVIDTNDIRTIVNLRGPCPEFAWYQDECRVSHDRNVSQEDIVLSAIRLPPPAEVQRLVQILDQAQYPILLHCRQGVDRTGLASVIVRLLEPGISLSEARSQLSICFGYVPFNGTENILKFVDLYEEWLESQKLAHSPELFRYWVNEQYCPGPCRANLELTPDPAFGVSFPAGRASTITLRAHNQSIRAWKLKPGTWQGIHARYELKAADGRIVFQERAGLFDANVLPRAFIDLTIIIPPLPASKYTLFIDMVDADQNSFGQFGGEPIFRELEVTGQW